MLPTALSLSDDLIEVPAPTTDETSSAVQTDRDIQRRSLRDLVALAAESAATESDIEREYRSGQEKAKTGVNDRAFEIEQRFKKAVDEANVRHKTRMAELAGQYKAQRTKIVAAENAAKSKLEADKAGVDEKLKKKYNDAVWLADSVFESANGAAAIAFKTKNGQVAESLEELVSAEATAGNLVQRYNAPLITDPIEVEPDPMIETDADAAFDHHRQVIADGIESLRHQGVASLFVGARAILLWIVVVAAVTGGLEAYYYFGRHITDPQWYPLAYAGGGAAVVMTFLLIGLKVMANRSVRSAYVPVLTSLTLARAAADKQIVNASEKRRAEMAAAAAAKTAEVKAAKESVTPLMNKAAQTRAAGVAAAQADTAAQVARVDKIRDTSVSETHEVLRKTLEELEQKRKADLAQNTAHHEKLGRDVETTYRARSADLQKHWTEGLARIQAPMDDAGGGTITPVDWNDPAWKIWKPGRAHSARVRFGEMSVDLKTIADNVPKRLTLPETFSLPALLAFPAQASLLIHTDHAGRAEAIRTLQMVMSRLLTTQPPGRVRFTIIDPVGLGQNFAGFMHLTDYDDALVGGRIWTSQEQIDTKLANLAEHMETVIQKYLRNEFQTIDDYNAQAGELAEPYRFLVISDLPVNFSTESFKRLNSIASSGARCGVYTLISRDLRSALPAGSNLDELKAHSVNIIRKDERFIWDDEVFRQLPLTLDPPPTEERLNEILHKVGQGAKEAKRVEVPFETIAPTQQKMWSGSTTGELDVMVGRLGANRFQSLKLGKGTAQHVLIAGKTGSGKSTLMHAMITNAALWYSPDEVELYLVDFKKGVEFKTYATNLLPHARAIAVESDREFGLSLLTRLDVELARRGELFRKAGVQDLASYRKTPNADVVPRTLLIIDEFQEFFTEDDKLAQEAALLIERLVRQGRAFGMHVLLGSQTIGGAGGLPRAVLGQFAVRIALQTTEADSQMILGDNNSAARLLTRPGEAIYNDAGGLVEGNSPFQVAYLSDAKRDVYLKDLASKAKPYFARFGFPIVFEGNAAADVRRNPKLNAALDAPDWAKQGSAGASAWLGEPVAIKDPTAIAFRRQSGANVIVVGQADEQALATLNMMIIGLAAQQSPAQARFVVLDGTPGDSPLVGAFDRTKAALPHEVKMIDLRAAADAVDEVAKEVARRQESDESAGSVYVFIYGLQRYRALRKTDDDYSSFSSSLDDDTPKKPNTGKQFAEILREGPNVGVHVVVWVDTMVSIDRTFDRGAMREFDNRVLFQMSAADSSNLIDSPSANKLGYHRALVYSEEQGTMERFRPYALPETDWLTEVRQKLTARST